MNEMTDVEIAWVSGIFEGEGCISIRKRGRGRDFNLDKGIKYEISLNVSMTDKDVVDSLQEKTGAGTVRPINSKALVSRGNKQLYRWTVSKRYDCIELLHYMLPYLHSRRTEKALEALERAEEAQREYDYHGTSPGAIRQRKFRDKNDILTVKRWTPPRKDDIYAAIKSADS